MGVFNVDNLKNLTDHLIYIKMDHKNINKVIEDCTTLETVILALANNVATRHKDLLRVQEDSINLGTNHLNTLLKREKELENQLENLKLEKNQLDEENKNVTCVNEEINEILTILNKPQDDHRYNVDMYVKMWDQIQEYEYLKNNLDQLHREVKELIVDLTKVISDVKSDVAQNVDLAVQLHKKKSLIRILSQQNKSAEEQFDLILNQLPWEPLTDEKLTQLTQLNHPELRAVADTVQLQTTEIKSLNKSIVEKKERKLEILSCFAIQLDNFLKERHEVTSLHRF